MSPIFRPSPPIRSLRLFRNLVAVGAAILAAPTLAGALTDAQKASINVAIKPNVANEYVLTIQQGEQMFRAITVLTEGEDIAARPAAEMAKAVGWRDDYLFVRQRSAGTFWRATVDHVFTIAGNKLVHVGAIDAAACKTVGCGYGGGVFRDLYDGLEVNPVTGVVDTMPLAIVRVVKDGRLVTDVERTWTENKTELDASLACVAHAGREGVATPCEGMRRPWSSLVFAAKLTHYTGRTMERDALFGGPAKAYCEKTPDSRCSMRVAGVKDHFSRFARGDDPKNLPGPMRVVAANAKEPERSSTFAPGRVIQLK